MNEYLAINSLPMSFGLTALNGNFPFEQADKSSINFCRTSISPGHPFVLPYIIFLNRCFSSGVFFEYQSVSDSDLVSLTTKSVVFFDFVVFFFITKPSLLLKPGLKPSSARIGRRTPECPSSRQSLRWPRGSPHSAPDGWPPSASMHENRRCHRRF